MRHIKRFPKPNILVRKEQEWTDAFLASTTPRPQSTKYGHQTITDALKSMSFQKCFYCETKLRGVRQEIDHYIEIAERRDLAFNWENLYLCCNNCNGKMPNTTIPIDEALNPCIHTDEEIQNHLTFEKEEIRPVNNSELGKQTIKKFRLDSDGLGHLRIKKQQDFTEILLGIKDNQINENRKSMTDKERESLIRFAYDDASFSLMFKILLRKYNIY